MEEYPHQSVLLEETLDAFRSLKITRFLDGTLGAGGHAEAILRAHPEIETYVGMDHDLDALAIAKQRLAPWGEKVAFIDRNFSLFEGEGYQGILLDLGVSSMHFDRGERGFSFRFEGPLDMRMDQREQLTAKEIVNRWPEPKLAEIFRDYAEIRSWRKTAKVIVEGRRKRPIVTTKELVDLIAPVARSPRGEKIHPATLVFQALRIAVNRELEVLEEVLPRAISALAPGGRLVVISFHRLEDRLVKLAFRQAEGTVITKKPLSPSEEERARLPRARSAKLRIFEK